MQVVLEAFLGVEEGVVSAEDAGVSQVLASWISDCMQAAFKLHAS